MKAIFKYPQTEVRTVYVGTYGGHYEAMFFFKSKPKKTQTMNDGTKYYCIIDNKDLVIGSMYRCDFETLYPDFDYSKIKPDSVEITKVHKIELEAIFDDYGDLVTFDYMQKINFCLFILLRAILTTNLKIMKRKIYLWSTIYNKLLNKGVNSYEIDIRYLQRWINLYPCCFPKFMLSNFFTAVFNWELCRWEIYKAI